MTSPMVRRLAPALLLLAGLTACTGSDPGDPSASPGGASPASESSSAEPSGSATPSSDGTPGSTQVEPSMGDDFAGILADVTTDACPTGKGKVEARGTVLNSSDKPRDLLITVVWLKKDSGDSVSIGYAALPDVAAGDTVEWSVPATLDRKAARCVIAAKANRVGTLP